MRWTSTERSGELVIAGVLFCIGFFGILISRTMPRGEFSVPGPGFFPVLLGALLCLVSLALGVQIFLSRSAKEVKIGHPSIWGTTFALIVVAVLFERLGFILMGALFFTFQLMLLSNLRWILGTLLAIAAATSAYLFFDTLLGIRLPSGIWVSFF